MNYDKYNSDTLKRKLSEIGNDQSQGEYVSSACSFTMATKNGLSSCGNPLYKDYDCCEYHCNTMKNIMFGRVEDFSESQHNCKCPIEKLMAYGCKCGGK